MAEGGEMQVQTDRGSVRDSETAETEQRGNQSESNMDAFDQVFERLRNERLNELRQIQNNNRPVTGQDNRSHINQFLEKNLAVRENVDAAHASGKENVPLNTANVEEHRPEAVVIEIQGVSQQQRVSSMLQTAAFRRHLENIIRGSLRTVSHNHSPASSHQASPSPLSTPARSQTPVNEPQAAPSRVSPAVSERRDSVSSRVTESSTSSSSSSQGSVNLNSRIQDPRGLLGALLNTAEPPPAPPLPDDTVPAPNWHTVEELQQETLVQEVSELLHRRLVSTALEGEFRNVLEVHVRQHLENTGTDGQRVQEYIRSIPQSDVHVQNDFSNLGIPPPAADNWDNVSVTSISATALPYTQTNLYLSREIASLKAQLQEMKNMMKVSFDLQLDIQRAIRQEVAAGIAAATAGGAVGQQQSQPKAVTTAKSTPINDTHCLICLDNHSDSVLYQCGHMCVCYPCGRHLMDRGAKCPMCRAPIRDIIRAYKCNQD